MADSLAASVQTLYAFLHGEFHVYPTLLREDLRQCDGYIRPNRTCRKRLYNAARIGLMVLRWLGRSHRRNWLDIRKWTVQGRQNKR